MGNSRQTAGLDPTERIKVLYITCSSFSGSTLLSFLLNTHPRMVTVGHTTGWNFGQNEDFVCSCGMKLQECPFYGAVEKAFNDVGLPFDIRNFGTEYRLAKNVRLNDLLVGHLPKLRNSRLERLRDQLVLRVPGWSSGLRRQNEANWWLIKSALDHANADVYVDNSHKPHRLRHLQRSNMFEIYVLHLIRDVRGVVLSNMTRNAMSATSATELWVREQANMRRITNEFPNKMVLHYDDLCDDLDLALGRIHEFVGLTATAFGGDFKYGEHHILGNQMRLRDGKVSRDVKWRSNLSEKDILAISSTAAKILAKRGFQHLRDQLCRYV